MHHVIVLAVMMVCFRGRLTAIARVVVMFRAGASVNRSYLCWHQFHSALRTLPRMILHHFRMPDAGILRLSRRWRRRLRKQGRMDCRD
jgi:hypothetical protein